MSETLGSLCDKLTILKLKQWHSNDSQQLNNIANQAKLLQNEINDYLISAINGVIPLDHIILPANKVYRKETNQIEEYHGNIGQLISKLALINCELWHQQEQVYEFEKVPVSKKDTVIKQLAKLNLERNQCIDELNIVFQALLVKK